MSEQLSAWVQVGILLAAVGTPFLFAAAWRLQDSVTQMKNLRTAKAVFDQVNAFEDLAKRGASDIEGQIGELTDRLEEVRLVCSRHDYLRSLTAVERAQRETHLWFFVGTPKARRRHQDTMETLRASVGLEGHGEESFVLQEYERQLWMQLERLTQPEGEG